MKVRTDSLLHFETCALIAVVAGLLLPWWAAGLVAIAAGIAKEVWDKYHDGVPSWSDLAWDVAGAIIGTVLTII